MSAYYQSNPHADFDRWDRANSREDSRNAWLARNVDDGDIDCLVHGLIREFESGQNRKLALLVSNLLKGHNQCGDTPMGDPEDVESLLDELTSDLLEARWMSERYSA